MRAVTGDRAVTIAGAVLAAALIPFVSLPHRAETFGVFVAFVIVTELLDTELPSGRRLCLSLAPGLAYAMLEGDGKTSAAAVGITFLVASLVAAGGRALIRREVRIHDVAMSFITVTAAAAAYKALITTGPFLHPRPPHLASVPGIAAVLLIALCADPLGAWVSALASRDPRPSPLSTLKSTAPLQVAIVSVAALVALAFPKLGWWSFPLFLGPLAATRYAFHQITTIKNTELQTLTALSKIPEMAGYTHPGHSLRVADMAVAMANELSIPEAEIRDIRYAALLHDIGRVVLEDPDAERAVATLRTEVASTGANIVAAAGTFPRVAEMIREQHQPYRRRGETTNVDVPLGARILRVANSYDDLVREGVFGRGPWDVLERLHEGQAHDYDPEVVGALARVLERAGKI